MISDMEAISPLAADGLRLLAKRPRRVNSDEPAFAFAGEISRTNLAQVWEGRHEQAVPGASMTAPTGTHVLSLPNRLAGGKSPEAAKVRVQCGNRRDGKLEAS